MKRIKLGIRNNMVIKRFLVLKDLILGKLDIIIASVKQSEQLSSEGFQASGKRLGELQKLSSEGFQASGKRLGELQESIDCLTENQVFLLKSSIDTVHAVHKTLSCINNLLENAGDSASDKHQIIADLGASGGIATELICYLYSYLPSCIALDVGANRGDDAERLLQAGYEVYAFEPFPPVFEKLQQRLAHNTNFHAIPFALGTLDETRAFHISADLKDLKGYDDTTFYNGFLPNFLVDGPVFQESIPVTVRSLAGLHRSNQIPPQVGLIKIHTEGLELDVIRGMEEYRYPVVMTAFWDSRFPFGRVGARNQLNEIVPVMRESGYLWHIIIYRIWPEARISFYSNSMQSFEQSWGDVLFFQDHTIFLEALKWCNATMLPTYFAGGF